MHDDDHNDQRGKMRDDKIDCETLSAYMGRNLQPPQLSQIEQTEKSFQQFFLILCNESN